jgi:phosphomannomutase
VNGAASSFTKLFLEELGCECFPLNDNPNGLFPHKPEPTPENISQLCEHIKKCSADIGFAQDPDADRLAIVNENGEPIGEDYTLVLAAKHLLEKSGDKETIVANVSITKAFDDIAAQFNANLIHTRIGEINVTEKILANNAIIGGEGNGGVIVPAVHPCRGPARPRTPRFLPVSSCFGPPGQKVGSREPDGKGESLPKPCLDAILIAPGHDGTVLWQRRSS